MIGSDVLGAWFLLGVICVGTGVGITFGGWGLAIYGSACCAAATWHGTRDPGAR